MSYGLKMKHQNVCVLKRKCNTHKEKTTLWQWYTKSLMDHLIVIRNGRIRKRRPQTEVVNKININKFVKQLMKILYPYLSVCWRFLNIYVTHRYYLQK